MKSLPTRPTTSFILAAVSLLTLANPARSDLTGIRIDEIGFACRTGDVNTAFLELTSISPGQTHDGELHLEVTNSLGALSDVVVNFGGASGSPWPQGQTWLLASSSFTAKTGIAPDGPPVTLQASAGALTLYTLDANGERIDIDTFAWGRNAGLPRAPYNGQSLQRVGDGFTRQVRPTPMNSSGATALGNCYGYDPQLAWVVDEALFACGNAAKGFRFVELRSLSQLEYDPNLQLRFTRKSGQTILVAKPFTSLAWQKASAESRFLIGSTPFQTGAGITADLTMTSLTDSLGGRVSILMPNSGGDSLTIVHELAYGITGAPAVPPAGSSLQRQSSGSFAPAFATPRNRAGQYPASINCFGGSADDPQWKITELGLACRASVPGFWFIELRSLVSQPIDGSVGLRILDHLGNLIVDRPDVLTITPGTSVTAQQAFLIASSTFASAVGMAPDLELSAVLDAQGGTIRVYSTLAGGGELDLSQLVYGSAPGGTPLPSTGGSIVLVGGAYQSTALATPQRSDSKTATGECFTGLVADGIRINEVGLRCRRGVPSSSFIELITLEPQYTFSERMGLRLYDRFGALLGNITGVVANHADQVVPQDATVLVAATDFASSGPTPDAPMRVTPDTLAGRLVLYLPRADGSEQVINDVTYGFTGGGLPPGGSLQRMGEAGYSIGFPATPTNLAGNTAAPGSCYGSSPSASVHLDELATRCVNGSAASFVELMFDAPHSLVGEMGLEIRDATGTIISDVATIYGDKVGQSVLAGQRLLLGSAGLLANTGRIPDASIPVELDPVGGRLTLYETISTTPPLRAVYASLAYGVPDSPAPAPGSSLVRSSTGAYATLTYPTPTDLSGSQPFARCWAPIDSAVRISELALACFGGDADTRFVELQSLDPLAQVDPGLGVRFLDGAGALLEEHMVVTAATLGRAWLESGRMLLAPAGFLNATSVAPDAQLSTGPSSESGEVQLFWRDDANTLEVVLDSWRYGMAGTTPLPLPGGAIVRQADGSRALTTIQSPRRFDGTAPSGDCFSFQSPLGIQVQSVLLQCSDRSTAAQFVEIRSTSRRALDPSVGLEVRGADGALLVDLPGVFTPRAWQPFATGASFLLAPASAEAFTGRAPDAYLPAQLDTLGGWLRLYHEPAGEPRIQLDEFAYGAAVAGAPAPTPGIALARDTSGGVTASFDVARSYPMLTWIMSECQARAILASVRVSEISLGCSHDPVDGAGQFIELRNDGPTLPSMQGYFLRVGVPDIKDYPLFVGREDIPFPAGGTWLVTGPRFQQLNGLAGDEAPLTQVPEVMQVQLFRQGVNGEAPTLVDAMGINIVASNFTYVPYGRSLERRPDGVAAIPALPNPRNSAGQTLNGVTSCLGRPPLSRMVPIAAFSPGCASGGPNSAYISFFNGGASATTYAALRLRIRDHNGTLTSDFGNMFNQVNPSPFVLGSVGFAQQAQTRAHNEGSFTLDALGGEIMVYEVSPDSIELVHGRYFYGPIAPGAGVRRLNGTFTPQRIESAAIVMPTGWSCYGDKRALGAFFLGAGADCGDGDPTTRYLQVSVPVYESCYWDRGLYCDYYVYPPNWGKIRTFDRSGALLDSVMLRRAAEPAGIWTAAGPLKLPLYGSGGLAGMLGVDVEPAPLMDPQGGTLQIIMVDPAGRDVAVVRHTPYGAAAGLDRTSPQWVGNWPTGSATRADMRYAISHCTPCGVHGVALEGFVDPGYPAYTPSTAVQYDTVFTRPGPDGTTLRRRFFVDGLGGNSGLLIDGHDSRPFMANTSTRFTVGGLPAGTALTLRARLAVTGQIARRFVSPLPTWPALRLRVYADGTTSTLTDRFYPNTPNLGDSLLDVRDTIEVLMRVTAGVPFRLTTGFASRPAGATGMNRLEVNGHWLFDGLPAGGAVTSCHGFGGGPVPVLLALARAEAFVDRVELLWQGGDAGESVVLERREESPDWQRLAELRADGTGQLHYRDEAVTPGSSYGYRLRASDGHATPETRVAVPVASHLMLALDGPQPVRGDIVFAITRPANTPARLELFDVAGRLVSARTLPAVGPSNERITLAPGSSRAGIFLARLSSGRERRVLRVVLVP